MLRPGRCQVKLAGGKNDCACSISTDSSRCVTWTRTEVGCQGMELLLVELTLDEREEKKTQPVTAQFILHGRQRP
ncbi:hypothetical protein MM560_G6n156 [Manis javanica]|nr:hypothetical protein MM560_G6n156 [Manis javanica]